MKQVIFGAIGTLFLSSACIAKDSDRTLELSGDYTIDVKINGQPFKMAIDPDIGSSRVLNAETAKKLGLKGSMIGGRHMVGPIRLTANSNVVKYDFGDAEDKSRTFWFPDISATTTADGLIAAAALPYKIVRFKLKPSGQGEKLYTLPLIDSSDPSFRHNAFVIVNDIKIAVGFSLDREEAIVTASTGLLLSEVYDGGFSGIAAPTMIRFGVERPTRPMVLKQPMNVVGMKLDRMLVRVSDFGDATQIKNGNAVDDDEIVVTGESKRKPRHQMELGRNFLSRCSTLTFDYNKKQVQMSCAL